MRKLKMNNGCKCCGSSNTVGMSRVVGYYSIIENWNDSKKAELIDRQSGDYKISETCTIMEKTLESEKFNEPASMQKVIMVE